MTPELRTANRLDDRVALPGREPTLALLGSDDPALRPKLDVLMADAAVAIDLRIDSAWIEVRDGLDFLERALDELGGHGRRVRFAHAPLDSSVAQRERAVIEARSLADLAVQLEARALDAAPPHFAVSFQPIVDLGADRVVGFEALLRATVHDVRVDTGTLIDRAGQGGWSHELDELGRLLALRGVGPWLGEGLLFLNVLAPDGRFDLDAVAATVAQAADAGVAADQLVFEITERNRYVDLDAVAADVAEMRDLGVRIAVDDVGDGHATLTVVAAVEPDIVKITGRLTSMLPRRSARSVVRAVVSMAHETQAWVIAENVETDEQAAELRDLGVDWAQGHLFGKAADRPTTTR